MRYRLLCSIVALLFLTLESVSAFEADGDPRIQGVWFGDGIHPMSRHVLIVSGDQFTIISPLGVFASKYSTKQLEPLNEIDLIRFDGDRQAGVFEVPATQLFIQLGEPNGSRPALKDVRHPDGSGHWHTKFKRRPTQEGLDVLTRHLNKLVATQ